MRATQPTPHGPITVSARRDNGRGLVVIDVEAGVPGLIGLRAHDEATGCALDLSTAYITHGSRNTSLPVPIVFLAADDVKIDLLHPVMQAAHTFVKIPAGHTSGARIRYVRKYQSCMIRGTYT